MLSVNLFDINFFKFFCKKKKFRVVDVVYRIYWYCVGEVIFVLSDI